MKTEEELEDVLESLNQYDMASYRGLPFDYLQSEKAGGKGSVVVRIQIYDATPDELEESYKLYIKLCCYSRVFVYSRQRGLEMLRDVFEEIRITMHEINTALGVKFDTSIWEA